MRLECDFIFDGIPSSEYGLKILSLGDAPDTETLVADKELVKVIAPNDNHYRILDATEKNTLTFKLQIFPVNKKVLKFEQLQSISNWMFNKTDYKKLQILDLEISHLYFNCILTNATKLMSAQDVIGIEFTVECDSNGAWEFEKTQRYDYSVSGSGTFIFNNMSSDINGIKPLITIEMFEDGDFSISNETTEQIVTINNLNIGEIITFDCGRQIISSSLQSYLFDDFNGEFLCLKQGVNLIEVTSRCKISLTYQNQVKVGC